MGKRGPKPRGKVKIKWSPDFAYAIGLLVSDGCLSPSGRHIVLTSKDEEMLHNFMKALRIEVTIGKALSGYDGGQVFRVQFGDVLFYKFLMDIGLMPNKSKIIGEVRVPDEYFFDFLRGSFDGDGCTYSYWDPRWRSSFMFYTTFVSASEHHVLWLRQKIYEALGIAGHISKSRKSSLCQLRYAKSDSLKLLRKMYLDKNAIYLGRKKLKIAKMLAMVGEHL